jgi:hypothetical protein
MKLFQLFLLEREINFFNNLDKDYNCVQVAPPPPPNPTLIQRAGSLGAVQQTAATKFYESYPHLGVPLWEIPGKYCSSQIMRRIKGTVKQPF